jgi:autotransporter strand-loop-strand O-heptosyltransferase
MKTDTINLDYNNCGIKINSSKNLSFKVSLVDKDRGVTHLSKIVESGEWASAKKSYYVNWNFNVSTPSGKKVVSFNLDLKGKNVSITNESPCLGDGIAWMSSVNEFQKKHGCNLSYFTPRKELFQSSYTNINFLDYINEPPGDYYASYKIGCFDPDNTSECFEDHKKQNLQHIAANMLGVEKKKERPILAKELLNSPSLLSPNKYVCISTASTSGSRLWQNEDGWQKTINYLNKLGYTVFAIQKERPGEEGAPSLKKVTYINWDIDQCIPILKNCDFFIGLTSGISWLSWALEKDVILISGITNPSYEFDTPCRVQNEDKCHGCWENFSFKGENWDWCPEHNGTNRHFECTKSISFEMVKEKIDEIIKQNNSSLL